MLKAVFHRNEHEYTPTLEEKHNFRFFVNVLKNQDTDKSDGELILEVKKFYALMHTDLIDQEEEYLLMRWNTGFDCWSAAKYNKFKAKEFFKAYCFVNCLLSKSARGMHYEEQSMDYFRCKFCKSHISQQNVRWLCLHKDCTELEEPFELCNLDFIGGKERSKMPHKIHHDMILLTKFDNPNHWTVSMEVLSQEDFLKNDTRCLQCK